MLEPQTYNKDMWGVGSALRVAALCSFIAAAVLQFRHRIYQCDRSVMVQNTEYVFILFVTLALLSLYAGLWKRWRLHRFLAVPGLIAIFAVLLFAGVYRFAMCQFGGWDEGLVVHAGTYYAQGLKPFIDFPCSMPPLFMAGARAGVRLFGLKWSSFALVSAIFAALTSLWIFSLLRLAAMPRHWALAVTVCVEVSTMLLEPFWYYNNSSAVSAVLLILSALACLQCSRSLLPWISLSFSLAMVLTAKPNTLPICLVVLVLFATKDKSQWAKTLAACAGSVGLAAWLCHAAQMPPAAVLRAYAEIAQLRASPLKLYPFHQLMWPEAGFQAIFTVLTALCLTALLVAFAKAKPVRGHILAICAATTLTSLEMAGTNAELKPLDLSLMLVAAAFLCLPSREGVEVSAVRSNVFAGLLSVFLVMSVFFSVTHLRVLYVLAGESSDCLVGSTKVVPGGFFSGLEAGEHLQRVLAQSTKVLARYPEERVFLGPRLEYAYPVFGKAAISGMPLLWDVGNLYAPDQLPHYLRTFQHQQPDLLIFLRGDYGRMGPVSDYIRHSDAYRRIDDFDGLTVYLRNK
jgi:hypothetical protein